MTLFYLAHFTRVNIGRNEGLTFYSVLLCVRLGRTHDDASTNKFMLATKDNTGKRQMAAGDLVPAEEAGKWFTRLGLAVALQVSVSTIDRMVKSEELPCVRLRGRVRFYLPDVVEALRKGNRKFGRAAELTAESAKIAERGQAS